MTTTAMNPGVGRETPVSNSEAAPPIEAAPPKKKARAPLVLGGLVVVAAVIGTSVFVAGRGKESTDDAFVEAHVASVAPRIGGQVVNVLVKDNQKVAVGDLLVELDDRDAKVKLDTVQADLLSVRAALAAAETQLALTEKTAFANLRQAKGGIVQASALAGASRAGIDQAKADIDAAEARRVLAEIELKRAQKLHDDGAVSAADLDAKSATYTQAVAAVAQATARRESAVTNVENAHGTIETARGRLIAAEAGPEQIDAAKAAVDLARARVAQATAAVEQASLNLSYTKVKAQVAGVVSRRNVEVGQLADPARPMMALTSLDDVWVVANFKEDQIAHIRSGQPVKLKVDAFSGRTFAGHVDSIAGGSGARFSLLPPDNASGNFTKVVQRIPVLLRFDDVSPDTTLRPGMSTYVTVVTSGH